jgi:hypothetical protein
MRRRIFISIFLMSALSYMLLINREANAQEISKSELELRAVNNFENQRYDKAVPDFELLNNMFPKDTRFAYFLGRSYLHSNQNLTKATELLKFVALRNYGEDAYFYLGRAYLLNYQFEEANIAFKTFQGTVSPRQLGKYDIDYWLKTCENARKSVGVAQKIMVENLQIVPDGAMEKAFTNNIAGKYIYVPDELRSENDIKYDYQTLMFVPAETKIGDFLYFDSKSKKSHQNSDIFFVRRVTADNYSLPEPLPGLVNTEYDEVFPFFDKETGTLYFSSRGHNTTGGLDIFRTSYDSLNKTWKNPERLNFPINTPSDDFLFTITNSKEDAVFLTNRNSKLKEFEAYTVSISKNAEFDSPFTHDEIINTAFLTPSAITVSTQDEVPLTLSERSTENPSAPVMTEYKAYNTSDEYSRLISEGMDMQSKSDSLSWGAKDIKLKADKETDYLKKQALIANMTTINQESKRMQRLADDKFAQADHLRVLPEVNLAQNQNAGSVKKSEKKELTQVTFKNTSPVSSDKEQNTGYQLGVEAGKNMGNELAANFTILNTSPYSSENPIPSTLLPTGLVYRIQLGAFSGIIPENAFGGLSPVSMEKGASETKYFVGTFTSIIKAREALEQVKKYGYPDAFLVSYLDQNKIPVQQAREIEFAGK